MTRVEPRKDRISWTDSHMLDAMKASLRSPDPNTQVGAVIISKTNRRLASGYNSLPNGICTKNISWARQAEKPEDTKYPYVVHAEKNAIYNAAGSVEGCTLYVTMYPCSECAKDIIQAGIKEIIYLTNPYQDLWQTRCAAWMFEQLDISVRRHKWNNPGLVEQSLLTLLDIVKSTNQ
jgi:dCMP deaminase